MKILIYGSTYITELVVNYLLAKDDIEIVGYIPSDKPVFPGAINLNIADEKIKHDIKLSLQYDKKIYDADNAYNLHTGLLPEYGGTNVLLHTIINKDTEQGLTFHKISKEFDKGRIIGKIAYGVSSGDSISTLYKKMCILAPGFAYAMIKLLSSNLKFDEYDYTPVLHKRKDVPEEYKKIYDSAYIDIQNWIREQRKTG